MYAVTAVVEYRDEHGNLRSHSLPTFYLDERVQGIVNEEHAERIALDSIDPGKTLLKVNMSVSKVDHPKPAEPEETVTVPSKEFFEMARMTVEVKAQEKYDQ